MDIIKNGIITLFVLLTILTAVYGQNFHLEERDSEEPQGLTGWIEKEKEQNKIEYPFDRQQDFPLDIYHTYDSISAYLDSIASKYGHVASLKTIGTTYEGNLIKGLKIGSRGKNKPAIWIDAGIHAREWITPATALYIISQLTNEYDVDREIKELVDTFDWYIFPVINVDGYKYTWTVNRMWRKNRSPSPKFDLNFCRGADPNRNFGFAFGGDGTSNDTCSEMFSGKSPFSEAESTAIRDGLSSLGNRTKAYFSLHAYSQVWMIPYGHSKVNPPDYEDQMRALRAAQSAINGTHGESYEIGTIANAIYLAAGSSVDWAYEVAKIKYSFGVELRNSGDQGFFPSNAQIIPTAQENFAGIKAVAKIIWNEN